MNKQIYLFPLLFLLLLNSLSAQSFQDIAPALNITTGYGNGLFGGGVSFCDFNGDGLDDLTLATGAGMPIRFFQNTNEIFLEMPPLVNNTEEVKQIIWVDYDNDGDKDLFLAVLSGFNRLYQNDGNMNMSDVTIAAQIPIQMNATFGASFSDYDNDGWLDLFISNRGFDTASAQANFLLQNNQDGTFSDVTFSAMAGTGSTLTFCASFFDYNNDLLPDLYLIEDKPFSNVLLQNNGGSFSDISASSNTDLNISAMNGGIGDYDNDGDLDIYITNTPQDGGNSLLSNNNDGTFTDLAETAGLTMDRWSWGGNWLDYDNDMDLDLYVCTSEVSATTPNILYENQGDGTFIELPTLLGDTTLTMANAIGDFNEDGAIDIIVNAAGTFPFMLWQNTNAGSNNWLKIAIEGVESNRDGIGVWIEASAGGITQYRYTLCGEAYIAQNSATQHIGMGTNTFVDEIKIRWPSGNVDILEDIAVNQKIKIKEGQGQILPTVECANKLHIALPSDNSIYKAQQVLTSNAQVSSTFMVQYEAGDCIELQTSFEVKLGAEFSAEIANCQ